MNTTVRLLSLFLLASFSGVRGQVFTFESTGINEGIPDGNPTGFASVLTINSVPNLIVADLKVRLSISGTGFGGFNGDLYVSLQHESGFTVLLNRPGRRSNSSSGYSDSGFNINFDDSATRDVHNYRFELNESHSIPISGGLTGTWSPDARSVDPSVVIDGSDRTAFLESFNGTLVNGSWTLFVSDLSVGGTQQLDSWSMEITAVPEPASFGIAVGVGLLGFALWRRLQPTRALKAVSAKSCYVDTELRMQY